MFLVREVAMLNILERLCCLNRLLSAVRWVCCIPLSAAEKKMPWLCKGCSTQATFFQDSKALETSLISARALIVFCSSSHFKTWSLVSRKT